MKYYEEQRMNTWILILLIITILSPLIGIYSLIVYPSLTTPVWVLPLLIILEGLLIFTLLNFYKLKIKVYRKHLVFSFGFFIRSFKSKNIISCKPVKIKFGDYLGIGIRLGWDGSIAFNTRFGNAVRIKIKKHRDYVLTSNNPRKLCKALKIR